MQSSLWLYFFGDAIGNTSTFNMERRITGILIELLQLPKANPKHNTIWCLDSMDSLQSKECNKKDMLLWSRPNRISV